MKDLLLHLSNAPKEQIEPAAAERLRYLSENETFKSDELLAIIDDCVFFAWASGFAIAAMNAVWKIKLNEEGLTAKQACLQRDPTLRVSAPYISGEPFQ